MGVGRREENGVGKAHVRERLSKGASPGPAAVIQGAAESLGYFHFVVVNLCGSSFRLFPTKWVRGQ